jgi:hypothetical membrane protein
MKVPDLSGVPLVTVGGLLTIGSFSVFSLVSSILYDGRYSPLTHWISDLGSPSKNPSGFIFFELGCILAGISVMILVAGLARYRGPDPGQDAFIRLAQGCGLLMALAIVMVGLFSEDTGLPHFLSAATFFLSLLAFQILVNAGLRRDRRYPRGIRAFGMVSIAVDLAFLATQAVGLMLPILEWSAVLSGLLWIGLLGLSAARTDRP